VLQAVREVWLCRSMLQLVAKRGKAWSNYARYQKFEREGMILQGLSSSIKEFFNRLAHFAT